MTLVFHNVDVFTRLVPKLRIQAKLCPSKIKCKLIQLPTYFEKSVWNYLNIYHPMVDLSSHSSPLSSYWSILSAAF